MAITFNIHMGVPEMESLWNDLTARYEKGQLCKDEQIFFKKLVKVLGFLEVNPRHNSLKSHEIPPLTVRYGNLIWRIALRPLDASSGHTVQEKATSQSLLWNHIRKTRSTVVMPASNCQTYHHVEER